MGAGENLVFANFFFFFSILLIMLIPFVLMMCMLAPHDI